MYLKWVLVRGRRSRAAMSPSKMVFRPPYSQISIQNDLTPPLNVGIYIFEVTNDIFE